MKGCCLLYMENNVINIQRISKSFKNNIVLNNIDLVINSGDVIYIKGINGSGKSTLLKLICGLMEPDQGSITINPDSYIGALIENPAFIPYASLAENLEFLYNIRNGNPSKDECRKIQDLCQLFHLDYSSRKALKSYSVGMKQKAGIIQAIMEDQDIILLDEPTRGLDEEALYAYKNLMKSLNRQGKTIVVAAHDFEDIGFNRILTLKNGKIIEN